MELTYSRLRLAAAQLGPFLRSIGPHSGRLWLDLVLLLVVGALHHTVIPSLTGSLVPVDLMTPWLVTALVLETLPRGALLAAVAAMILETHTAAPAGLYLCAYWVVAVTLYLTRSTLSWRHAFPWLVTFFVSQLWVIVFETFVIAVSAGSLVLELSYVAAQTARLLFGILIGMVLCRRFMNSDVSEEAA